MTEEEADAFARKFYEGWDPYGGQSVVDREAELNALLAEQGYLEDLKKPYGELPVFLTDLIGEYPTIGGNILPSDQGTAVEPAPTGDGILDVIKSIPGAAVDTAKSAADTLLKQIQEFLPFYDQSQVVLNPRTGQATIVFGTPPSGSPVIQAGNLPKSNTNVGVTTGIPILDQAINSVLKRPGGLESGSIRDEVIKVISEQAGLDPAAAAGILGEDLETIFATANADVANTASQFGVDLTGEKEDDVVRDTDTPVVKGPPAGDQMGPTIEELMGGAAAPDSVDTVLSGGDLTPADLGETPSTVTVEGTPSTVETGGGGATATPGVPTPAPSQGMRMESTEKAGLAEIDNQFDLDASLAENLMRILSGKSDNEQESAYYGGGKVGPHANIDEIIRLLRG
jgi:hypothetical protein